MLTYSRKLYIVQVEVTDTLIQRAILQIRFIRSMHRQSFWLYISVQLVNVLFDRFISFLQTVYSSIVKWNMLNVKEYM